MDDVGVVIVTRSSERMARTLAALKRYMDEHGRPPTERELGAYMGLAGSTVGYRLKVLEREGYIEREPGKARTISITAKGRRA